MTCTTIMPPSPFISATAETLPSEFSGKSHYSDGSFFHSSCGIVESQDTRRFDGQLVEAVSMGVRPPHTLHRVGYSPADEVPECATEVGRPTNPSAGFAPGPQEAFVVDEDSFFYAIDPPPLPEDHIEGREIEQILRALFSRIA